MAKTPDYEYLLRPVSSVKGISERRASLLARCGVGTLYDGLTFYPFRYEDYLNIVRPDQLKENTEALCYGRVVSAKSETTHLKRRKVVTVVIENAGGYVKGIWFNQPWMKERFKEGGKVLFHGVARFSSYGLNFVNPDVVYLDDDFHPDDYEGRRLPVYHSTENIAQGNMRRFISDIVGEALPHFKEYLPAELRREYSLMDISEAVKIIHDPQNRSEEELLQAKRRLIVDEFFVLQFGILLTRRILQKENYEARHLEPGELIKKFLSILPFKLTESQLSVLSEIKRDMLSPHPMHRLLQGDVGCGKTVVAATAMLMAVESGYNAVIMAPTEILARQHYLNLSKWCEKLGVDVLLSLGGMKAKEKKAVKERMESGRPFILIGTHSLLFMREEIPNLGLLVIDEQHKFGVAQRALLRDNANIPDTLVMTATPIPRSLAMTLYGHMDISVIKKPPEGRMPVMTYVVTPDRLEKVWAFIRKEVQEGRQAYVVYPRIDESEKTESKAAAKMYEELSKNIFPDLRVGLVHGRLGKEEKEQAMEDFRTGRTNVLVCTTVIEVGVDVPNASVMVIEDAQRFGLAQLHQLRGRIGRGKYASYCVLVDNTPLEGEKEDGFYQPLLMTANKRLEVMARTSDGFEIAEADMEQRGPGEVFGEKQSGQPLLLIANPSRDKRELSQSAELARKILEDYDAKKLPPAELENLYTRIALRYGPEFTIPGF